MSALTAHCVGDRALLVEVADNAAAQRLFRFARTALDLEDVVPGHETVLLIGRRSAPHPDQLARWDSADPAPEAASRHIEIVVSYGAPDLDLAAELCQLSREEFVRRHMAARYTVAFVGFAPGFPYLLGGDPAIRPPRRDEPRTRVPAGALAVAAEYTSIYPASGPGGWQLIGHTDAVLFDASRDPPSLLEPGDFVSFKEVT